MGKKILVGCLLLVLVAGIALSVGLYYYVYRPAKDVAQKVVENVASAADVSALNAQVENQAAFSAPENGELTSEQVERFARVQRHLLARIEERFKELGEEFKKYERQLQGAGDRPGLGTLMEAWSEIGEVYKEVKKDQVAALNEQQFSLDEYNWVKSQFYRALGTDVVAVGMDQIAEAIEKKDPGVLNREKINEYVPEKNRDLARPYKDEAAKWVTYAWLGL